MEFICPRCHRPAAETFYGPCGPCRAELRAAFVREPQAIEVGEYEPKVNVTPNAVALNDD